MSAPLDVVAAFAELDVLVLGEPILDGWLAGSGLRLSREAPVGVVDVASADLVPGGAGNTAVNLAALGARVRLLAAVGDDADGAALRQALHERGVCGKDVQTVPGRRTCAKRRILAGGQMLLRYDEGDTGPLPVGATEQLLDRLDALWGSADVVVVSDYGLGVLSDAVVQRVAQLQSAAPTLVVVDAREPGRWRSAHPTAVKPNAVEVGSLLGGTAADALAGEDRAAALESLAEQVLDAAGAELVAVTLDVDGAVLLERDRPSYRLWADPVAASQAAGAGDSFTAALALALRAGADATTAGELAAAAARVVCQQPGTTACTADELRATLLADGATLLDLPRLASVVRAHRLRGRRLVLTNGVFDVLHRGHVTYLNQAKALGDVLVVALTSDASVKRLKGASRPVNGEDDRAAVLRGLSCVDHVVVFDGDTAAEVVDAVRPDSYVKGGDYRPDMLPEAPLVDALGGRVVILPYLEDRSTTSVLARLQAASGVQDHAP